MTDAFTDPAAQPPAQSRGERNFDQLNPSFAADHAARADDRPGLRTLEDGLVRGWAVTLSEHLENTGPSGWRQQHVADRASDASERAARAERQVLSDAEDAFARLNPDFGVLPDPRDAGQHAFAQQREAALALGTRAAVAAMDEAHPDREQRQAAITARAMTAARPGRRGRLRQAREDRPRSPAVPRRAERPQRRSGDRRPQLEREEERSR
jgi:hypothetical protein